MSYTITDLTGYTWVGNETIDISNSFTYSLNFISNSNTFTSIKTTSGFGTELNYDSLSAYSSVGGWPLPAYKTIQIIGGTDATNTTLIQWLLDNGTLTAPIQANTYNLTHNLTNLTKGNITLQITPDANYTYPTSLTITNGTLISYDNTTGIAVISGDDTTIVDAECVAQASGYSGNIIAYNSYSNSNYYTYIKFDTAPTNNNDYDSYVYTNGVITGLTSYQNKTKVYVWGPSSQVRINGTTYNGSYSYSTATEVLLTGNYNIELKYSAAGVVED